MKIGLNLFHLVPENGGVAQYVLTLLQHWPLVFPQDELVLFCFPRNAAALASVPAAFERRMFSNQDEIPSALSGVEVYFCPFNSLYPRPLPLPSVVTMVDLQERFFPEFFSPEDLRLRFHHYDWSVAMADQVITISDFSRESLVRLLGAPPSRIARIHLCPAELPEATIRPVAWEENAEEPFLLYPANFWRHKNHRTLFAALARLRSDGLRVPAVFTGTLLGREDEWAAQVAQAGVKDQVRHLGLVSRAELSWIYRRARCLCVPSLFEGFGIPLVEAMRLGVPVACSATTSLPEIAGSAAVYFDPQDPAALARTVAGLWTDAALRRRLAAKGRIRERRFTAERLVREHRACFVRAIRSFSAARHAECASWAALPDPPRESLSVHERLAAAELLRTGPSPWWRRMRRFLSNTP